MFALQEAVHFGSPLEFVKLLYDKSPRVVVDERDIIETLPLHRITRDTPLEVVQFLVDTDPEALLIYGGESIYDADCLPIHIAIRVHASKEVVQLLVGRNRDALMKPDGNWELPIHVAVAASDLDEWMGDHPWQLELVRYLAEQCPESVTTFTQDPEEHGARSTFLHEGYVPELPIHVAARTQGPQQLEIIQFLAQQYPESLHIETGYEGGELPIHLAAQTPGLQQLEIIQFLAQQNPESLRVEAEHEGGELPIHLAAKTPGPQQFQIIQFLAQQNPESLGVTTYDGDGELPIHLAAKTPGPQQFQIIQFLAQQNPESLGETTYDGDLLPLHLALRSCSPPAVVEHLLQGLPKEVPMETRLGLMHYAVRLVEEIKLEERDGDQFSQGPGQVLLQNLGVLAAEDRSSLHVKDAQGWLPIHVAVHLTNRFRLPVDLVQRLTELDPATLHLATTGGDLPIHLAVAGEERRYSTHNGCPLTTFFFEGSRQSVGVAGSDGNCPIHTAIVQRKFALVYDFVELAPDACRRVGADKRTPLHVAATHPRYNPFVPYLNDDNVLGVVRLLIGNWQESLLEPDAKKDLPIHVAIASLENDWALEVVTVMLEHAPQAVRQPGAGGMLPLHVALSRDDPSLPMVQLLLGGWHDALTAIDTQKMLPLHLAVSRNNPSFTMIQFLVEEYGEALVEEDKGGIAPLWLAIRNRTASLDVIYYLMRANPQLFVVGRVL